MWCSINLVIVLSSITCGTMTKAWKIILLIFVGQAIELTATSGWTVLWPLYNAHAQTTKACAAVQIYIWVYLENIRSLTPTSQMLLSGAFSTVQSSTLQETEGKKTVVNTCTTFLFSQFRETCNWWLTLQWSWNSSCHYIIVWFFLWSLFWKI